MSSRRDYIIFFITQLPRIKENRLPSSPCGRRGVGDGEWFFHIFSNLFSTHFNQASAGRPCLRDISGFGMSIFTR